MDPKRGSPSGYIYEIPLEGARDDAAPGSSGGGSGGSGGSGTGGTADERVTITSDSGYGSSPVVPGAAAQVAGRQGAKSGKGGGGSGNGQGAGSGSGNGLGAGDGSATGGGGSGPAIGSRQSGDAGDGSLLGAAGSATVPLLVLGLAGLVGAGLALPLRSRRRPI